VPVFQPLWVIETPMDGVGAHTAPPSNNSDGIMGFIKSSSQNKAVHMELSLRLSFQLSHSLGGYMVGTTVRFQVTTMEALAP
jgi:hypothetical protein